MDQVISVVISVTVGVSVGAALFIGVNLVLDQATRRWTLFIALLGALIGLVVGAVLQHNEVFPSGLPGILLGGAIFAAIGAIVGKLTVDRVGQNAAEIAEKVRPALFVGPALFFVTVGLVIPAINTFLISFRSGDSGDGGFSLEWYQTIFTDKIAGTNEFFNFDNFGDIFTSRLFIATLILCMAAGLLAWSSAKQFAGGDDARTGRRVSRAIGITFGAVGALMVIGLIEGIARDPNESLIYDVLTVIISSPVTLGLIAVSLLLGLIWWITTHRRTGHADLDWGSPGSSVALVAAVILLLFAVLSTLQAVIWNNLWWVVSVAGLSTVLGLLLAILADRTRSSRTEVGAKAMIFLPMAISMVGAAVIWDFVYERQPSGAQTGLFNAILEATGFQTRGFFVNASMIPWNNLWIMVIMIWIQTGFAMVVLSAAIKGVPDELLEAARVDGATEVQTFWRVVIPQIRSTILVVVTTLIIIVMKVFDLVKATTGGANRTNVLANEMFDQLVNGRFALSSAFAVVIFALVIPIMIMNIRRTRADLN